MISPFLGSQGSQSNTVLLGSPPDSWPWETNDDDEGQGEQLLAASGGKIWLLGGMILGNRATSIRNMCICIYIYIHTYIYIYIYICVCVCINHYGLCINMVSLSLCHYI